MRASSGTPLRQRPCRLLNHCDLCTYENLGAKLINNGVTFLYRRIVSLQLSLVTDEGRISAGLGLDCGTRLTPTRISSCLARSEPTACPALWMDPTVAPGGFRLHGARRTLLAYYYTHTGGFRAAATATLQLRQKRMKPVDTRSCLIVTPFSQIVVCRLLLRKRGS